MRSQDIIAMGAAVWLVLRLTGQQRPVTGIQAGMVPANNQNADLWLKTGALQIGRDLLKEVFRGGASVVPAVTAGAGVTEGLTGWGGGALEAYSTWGSSTGAGLGEAVMTAIGEGGVLV